MKQQPQTEQRPQLAVQRFQQRSRTAWSERATIRPRFVRILQQVAAIALFWSATAGSAMAAEEASDAEPVEAAPDESVWNDDGFPNPEAFSFVVHENGVPYVILRPEVFDEYGQRQQRSGAEQRYNIADETGAIKKFAADPEYLGSYGRAFQPLTTLAELGKWDSRLAKSVYLVGSETECVGTIEAVGHLVRFVPEEYIQEFGENYWEAFARMSDRRIAQITVEREWGSAVIAARVSVPEGQDCSGAIWGRSADLAPLKPTVPGVPAFRDIRSIEQKLRRLPEWTEAQAEWTRTRQDLMRGGQGSLPRQWERWNASKRDRHHWLLSLPGGPAVEWSDFDNRSCGYGGYWCKRLSAFALRAPGAKDWTVVGSHIGAIFASALRPTMVVDLDNDRMPEIIFGTRDQLVLMRFRDGTYTNVLEYRIQDRSPPC
jgi:hypothetical protein